MKSGPDNDSPASVEIETKDGVFTAYFSERGLARLDFPVKFQPGRPHGRAALPRSRCSVDEAAPQRHPTIGGCVGIVHSAMAMAASPENSPWIAILQSALEEALQAKAPRRLPPLDLEAGRDFQQSVWRALLRIPPGQTMSYGKVAQTIGHPKAVRAVGQACGANPIPVLIPCHRVIAAHGAIGGFSCGLELKRLLLEREGIRL
jgi:O-6-methylguanine DNA methyltransferase